jgi:hypothetical protein
MEKVPGIIHSGFLGLAENKRVKGLKISFKPLNFI